MQIQGWESQFSFGELTLNNRIIMSALTRERCPENGVPTDMVAEYYAQRASAAMIFTQTTAWAQRGRSSTGSANLYTQEHAEGWLKVTDAVHKKGGKIFVQINHAGRATNQQKTLGLQVWAPSAIHCRQKIRYLGMQEGPVPKSMSLEDIQQVKKQFRQSMVLAKKANFDGIQLEGAHGYLIDQFLRSCTNKRTDKYGGSVQNRVRFCLELFDIAIQYFKPEYLGIKISPVSRGKDMFEENPEQLFGHLLREMSKKGIGYAEIRQSTQPYTQINHYGITSKEQLDDVCKTFRPYFKGVLIGNDSFTRETGLQKIKSGSCDAISFGQWYIGNPDLAERIIHNHEINTKLDRPTFYGSKHGPKGYIDYPFYSNESKL